MINRIFSKIEYLLHKRRVNVFKTIYINLRSLPFGTAIKFPVFVYGKCKFQSLRGRFEIEGEIKRGMIRLGVEDIRSVGAVSVIKNRGIIKFRGKVVIRAGMKIAIIDDAILTIGKNSVLGDLTTIFCVNRITIGNGVRFANNVIVMDTDFHYLLNVETGEILNNKKEIVLGNYNWIGSFVTIKKGACTPDFTIVVGPYSTIGKDYRNIIEPYTMIAGNPAKAIKTGYLRVFNEQLEKEIKDYYSKSNTVFKLNLEEIDKCFYNE